MAMINDTMPISLKGNPTQWGDNIKKYIQDLSNGDNLLSLSQSILGVTSNKDYLMVNPNLGGGNASIIRNNDYLVSHLIPTTGITSLTIKIKKQLIVPLLLIAATFAANYFFDINIMYLVLLDGVIGYLALQDAKYN